MQKTWEFLFPIIKDFDCNYNFLYLPKIQIMQLYICTLMEQFKGKNPQIVLINRLHHPDINSDLRAYQHYTLVSHVEAAVMIEPLLHDINLVKSCCNAAY